MTRDKPSLSQFPAPQFHGATTVSAKGQVVIPAGVRRALGLEDGDKLLVFVMGGSVMLSPVAEMEKFAAHMAGRLEAMRTAIRSAEPDAPDAETAKPRAKTESRARGRVKHERGERPGE